MFDFSELSFVVQGPVVLDKMITKRVLDSIRGNFQKSTIILSTWEGASVDQLTYDKVVLSKDPGGIIADDVHGLYNNVNRQILSSLEGLKLVDTKYVIKTRTDIFFNSATILDYMTNYREVGNRYNLTRERVLVLSDTSYNPHRKYQKPYHICDFLYAGLTVDIVDIFDIPLMPLEYFRWFDHYPFPQNATYDTMLSKYIPETYIWISFLSKHMSLSFEHSFDISNNNIEISEDIIGNNLCMISSKRLNITNLKYPYLYYTSYQKYSYVEWVNLYRKNVKLFKLKIDLELLCLGFVYWLKESLKLFPFPYLVFRKWFRP